jgi:hypothetical protein
VKRLKHGRNKEKQPNTTNERNSQARRGLKANRSFSQKPIFITLHSKKIENII